MAGIPPALDTDAEDVAWALQTAEALWKRGERADAIVWLRRGAQSAGDAQDDDRALVLARAAAELAEFLAHNPVISESAHHPSEPPSHEVHGVDDLLRSSSPDIPVSVSEPALPVAHEPSPPAPVAAHAPAAAPLPRLGSSPEEEEDEPTTLEVDVREVVRKSATSSASSEVAPTAAEAHRGMLDPWAAPPPLPPRVQTPPPPPDKLDDEEVITSAKHLPSAAIVQPPEPAPTTPQVAPPPAAPPEPAPPPAPPGPPPAAAKPAKPPPLPPKKPPPVPKKPPKRMAARRERVRREMRSEPPPSDQPPAQLEEEGKVYTADPISMLSAARGGAPSRPPSIPPEGPGSIEPATIELKAVSPPVESPPIVRPPPEPTLVSAGRTEAAPVPEPAPEPPPPPHIHEEIEREDEPTVEAPILRVQAPIAPEVEAPVAAVAAEAGPEDLALENVPGLSDLPDEERAKLQASAKIHRLSQNEEVGGFALALVVRGDVDVAAQIVDVPADRIGPGTVLRGRGTIADCVPLRLLCASKDAVVATWQAAEIDPALETCPWVVDDLRAQADRIQALVGVTLGPLAERLDTELRRQVTSKLQLRELAEGEIIVEQDKPVRQILIVGQGHIELVKDNEPHGSVGAGELLFPSEILSAGKAPATARAGKGGALVLQADRMVAQELMVTCPPLLEIFGGM